MEQKSAIQRDPQPLLLTLEPSDVMQQSFQCYGQNLGLQLDIVQRIEQVHDALVSAGSHYDGLLVDLSVGLDAVKSLLGSALVQSCFQPEKILLVGTAQQRQRFHDIAQVPYAVILKPLRSERLRDAVAALLASQGIPKKTSEVPPDLISDQRSRLLVVEDNVVNQQVARGRLEKMGFEVRVVENGAAALDLLQQEHFDLIFMDCQMPVLDGYQTTRRIRQDANNPAVSTPIIAMTAHAMAGDREHCLRAGMDDYVAKPFKTDELRMILERWLKKKVN